MYQSYDEIVRYITEVKEAVRNGKYRIETNRRRQANLALYRDYVIDEAKSKEILLDLTANDFCEVLNQFVIVISFHKQAYPLTYAFH